jgi:GTPase-associated system helical domain
MSISIFDQYQKNGLLPQLGGSDDIYEKLKAASETIATDLEEHPSKILTYTLVAFDNQISEGEPVLEEVEQKIREHWNMVRSQFPEMPIALYRAVMLQALEDLVEQNTEGGYEMMVYLSIVNVYPHLNITEKERKILFEFLKRIGNIAEEKAEKEWSIDKKEIVIKLPTINFKLNETAVKIDENILQESLIAATGPHGEDGKARTNPNQYWSSNNGSAWAYQFAPRAAKGIAEVVNKALIEQGQNIDENSDLIEKQMNTFLAELNKSFDDALKESIQSSIAVEQRSQLLWWKETLYSRNAFKSYREMSKFECAVAMAIDLHELLPKIFPVNVDYILKEAFWGIHGFDKNEIKFIEFLKEVNDSKNEGFLKQYFEEEKIEKGRTDLTSFIKRLIYSKKVDVKKEILPSLGIASDKKVTYEEISVWILHCFSVKRLTQN